ncbi:response regulator [Deinococcus peraridilitoris]|uniref:Response regulator containing a CheY-like receiver domain and a GGDEF domain protein n=1 Tax=Deinococcus peraridilitoris (strain DSM 19664 / LMG 22246 / CIP 109416 / KR-200) TaxID=937777 RepID=L0A1I3_DEIPD|nr:response regulator containing a CheY-like receiver domain and a GGDEF domain protein [Deinococcus peraridilitoris DSM 19664]
MMVLGELPYQLPEVRPAWTPRNASFPTPPSPQERGASILELLVIDDNEYDLLLTELAFQDIAQPCTLHIVHDGHAGLTFLRDASQPRPAAVLLDLHMPRMDGFTFLQHLREDPHLKSLPVFVMTASTADQDMPRVRQLDADAFLVKPVEPQLVFDLLRTPAER